MKGEHFDNVEAIQQNVIRVLRNIPENDFSKTFQRLYERQTICKNKRRGYIKNLTKLFAVTHLFCIKNQSQNFLN